MDGTQEQNRFASEDSLASEVISLPIADVVPKNQGLEKPGSDLIANDTNVIRLAKKDRDDIFFRVRASVLNKSREKLKNLIIDYNYLPEISMSICTTSFGAILGSLPSNLKPSDSWYNLFWHVLPLIAVASLVAFYFLRKIRNVNGSDIARYILDELPNPAEELDQSEKDK